MSERGQYSGVLIVTKAGCEDSVIVRTSAGRDRPDWQSGVKDSRTDFLLG